MHYTIIFKTLKISSDIKKKEINWSITARNNFLGGTQLHSDKLILIGRNYIVFKIIS